MEAYSTYEEVSWNNMTSQLYISNIVCGQLKHWKLKYCHIYHLKRKHVTYNHNFYLQNKRLPLNKFSIDI